MAYLGRRGASAPLTSADIPVGIVEGTDVAFLENASATQNLSGTYSTERMYLNDSYTLTGDVTVTGHLALGSIADEDIVITQDGTERTITGSGTIDAGNVLQDTHRTSLTDMTGELGSAVTGGSGLTALGTVTAGNLSNTAIVYPAGHVLQVVTASYTTSTDTTATGWTATGLAVAITPSSTTSKILVVVTAPIYGQGLGTYAARFTLFRGGVSGTNLGHTSTGFINLVTYLGSTGQNTSTSGSMSYLDSPSTTSTQTYTAAMRSEGNSAIATFCAGSATATMTLMEIAG